MYLVIYLVAVTSVYFSKRSGAKIIFLTVPKVTQIHFPFTAHVFRRLKPDKMKRQAVVNRKLVKLNAECVEMSSTDRLMSNFER